MLWVSGKSILLNLSLATTLFAIGLPKAHALGKGPTRLPEYSARIFFAEGVPSAQAIQLQSDLILLEKMQLWETHSKLMRTMHLERVTGPELRSWLEERVQLVVAENLDVKEATFRSPRAYDYESPTLFPDPDSVAGASEQRNVSVVMANVGTLVYWQGKRKGALLGMEIPAFGKVEIPSPRIGIIRIGKGLFFPLTHGSVFSFGKGFLDPRTEANSLSRLSTLFHEARHSDGNGRSLGFFHTICPKGHSYAGYSACDRNLNGPYTVGAQILATFAKNCKTCSTEEREALRLSALDSFDRVIQIVPVRSPKSEDRVHMVLSTEWDDRPEGRR